MGSFGRKEPKKQNSPSPSSPALRQAQGSLAKAVVNKKFLSYNGIALKKGHPVWDALQKILALKILLGTPAAERDPGEPEHSRDERVTAGFGDRSHRVAGKNSRTGTTRDPTES